MDQQEIYTLKLLDAIDKDDSQSQRVLAKKLGISLGLVNSLLKKIAKKGYFKVTNVPRNRVKYILTPKGFSEKLALTYRYISHSVNFYIDIRDKICKVVKTIVSANQKEIIILGANELTEIACIVIRQYELNLIAIIDDNKAGEKMFGMTIAETSFLENNQFDAVIVALIDPAGMPLEPLSKLKMRRDRVYTL